MNRNGTVLILGIPLWWLITGYAAWHLQAASRVFLLVVVPSLWIAPFGDWLSMRPAVLFAASLPVLFLIGLVLHLLKMTPLRAFVSILAVATFSWLPLLWLLSGGTDIHIPYAKLAWLLCCASFAPLALPAIALANRLWMHLAARRPPEDAVVRH